MILVAGPYRSGTDGDPTRIAANVDAMTRVALELYRRGHLPVLGEWFALPLIEQAEREGAGGDPFADLFHPVAERVLARCDACLRIGGSIGRRGPHGRYRAAPREDRVHLDRGHPVSEATFSKSEMMIVAAARALEGQHVCFVGVGLPNIAVNLAQRTVAPTLELRLRGRRVRGSPAAAAAEHRRPDDRHRLDRRREHARAVRLLPAGRPGRCRVPGRGPDRPLRQHQHDGHRALRPPDDATARQRAAHARSPSTRGRSS